MARQEGVVSCDSNWPLDLFALEMCEREISWAITPAIRHGWRDRVVYLWLLGDDSFLNIGQVLPW